MTTTDSPSIALVFFGPLMKYNPLLLQLRGPWKPTMAKHGRPLKSTSQMSLVFPFTATTTFILQQNYHAEATRMLCVHRRPFGGRLERRENAKPTDHQLRSDNRGVHRHYQRSLVFSEAKEMNR
jgi:hypothetical protein